MSATALFRPTFTDLRSEIERRVAQGSPAEEIGALIDQFLAAGGERPAPVVEYDGTVTWIFRSAAAESVAVVGDIIGFDPRSTRMARLAGSDLFYLTAQIPLDAQLAYAFSVDNPAPEDDDPAAWSAWIGRCQPDPLNHTSVIASGPLRTASVLSMPGDNAAPDIPDHDPAVVDGLSMHLVAGVGSQLTRVWVALPSGYDIGGSYPALYFTDADGYLFAARAPEQAAALAERQEIEPAVLVFVEGGIERGVEPLARAMAESVVPWIEARYSVRRDPAARVICGASAAGAASLAVALSRPELFGGAIAQSPTAELTPQAVSALLIRAQARGTQLPRCYVDVGRYEPAGATESTHAICAALIEGGATIAYQEFAGDHSFLGWRASLTDALRFHLGATTLSEL